MASTSRYADSISHHLDKGTLGTLFSLSSGPTESSDSSAVIPHLNSSLESSVEIDENNKCDKGKAVAHTTTVYEATTPTTVNTTSGTTSIGVNALRLSEEASLISFAGNSSMSTASNNALIVAAVAAEAAAAKHEAPDYPGWRLTNSIFS
ncbi:unnamed protein product [Protopolystoma xenopodis]|uniref:Uncharacterized protein n=1 Tax=Protopolystoma xenopodis TaxID=117903 RepID=A0A3S5A6R1_9PLAT|nr:unnamed protein product [Protopolystoma xenopodis]